MKKSAKGYKTQFDKLQSIVDAIPFRDPPSKEDIGETFTITLEGIGYNIVLSNLPHRRSLTQDGRVAIHYRLGSNNKRARALYELLKADLRRNGVSEGLARDAAREYHRLYLG